MIERRQFLSVAGTFCLAGVFGLGAKREKAFPDYLTAMRTVLQEQGRQFSVPWYEWNEENLQYAYSRIRPTTHFELAFLVSVILCGVSSQEAVDEYVRRRSGEPPLLFDHPVFELKRWGMPDTHGVLVFREQRLALLQEVCDCDRTDSSVYIQQILTLGRSKRESLRDIAARRCPGALSPEDVDLIETSISYYAKYRMFYAFCSTMAVRTEAIVRSEMV